MRRRAMVPKSSSKSPCATCRSSFIRVRENDRMNAVIQHDPRGLSKTICDGRTSISFADVRRVAHLLGSICRPNVHWIGCEPDFDDRRGERIGGTHLADFKIMLPRGTSTRSCAEGQ